MGNITRDDIHGFFRELNLYADVEGTTVVPSCTPSLTLLPVNFETLEWKRSFFLAYFPVNLWNDFATMLLGSLTVEGMEFSLNSTTSIDVNPLTLKSGTKLYVWKHNILFTLDNESSFYIYLDSSTCGTEDEYLYRRIDIRISGSLEVQAKLMGITTITFHNVSCLHKYIHKLLNIFYHQVLSTKYPGFLRTNLGSSLVDDFIPLELSKQQKVNHDDNEVTEIAECKHHRAGSTSSCSLKLSRSFPSLDKQLYHRSQSEVVPALKRNTSILQWFKDNDVTFNCSTAVLDEVYGPDYIPFSVWECLEIAYHSSVVMHCGIPVCLEEYMPEIFLSLTSLPRFRHSTSLPGLLPESSCTESYLLSDKEVQETGGFFLRHFYKPSHKENCLKHSVNHNRMVR